MALSVERLLSSAENRGMEEGEGKGREQFLKRLLESYRVCPACLDCIAYGMAQRKKKDERKGSARGKNFCPK